MFWIWLKIKMLYSKIQKLNKNKKKNYISNLNLCCRRWRVMKPQVGPTPVFLVVLLLNPPNLPICYSATCHPKHAFQKNLIYIYISFISCLLSISVHLDLNFFVLLHISSFSNGTHNPQLQLGAMPLSPFFLSSFHRHCRGQFNSAPRPHHSSRTPCNRSYRAPGTNSLRPNKWSQVTVYVLSISLSCILRAVLSQAKAIILEATKQMEERRRSTCRRIIREERTSPLEEISMKSGTNPSMRRSLKRFLEKRKHRIQTISPYTLID